MKTASKKPFKSGDKQLDSILGRYKGLSRELISILQDVQEELGYLPEDALRQVAQFLDAPITEIYGVATFYKMFRLTKPGRRTLTACIGTACHVRGVTRIVDELSRMLGVRPGETTGDGEYSLETVNCLGCCAIGPVLVTDGKYHGQVTPQGARKLAKRSEAPKK